MRWTTALLGILLLCLSVVLWLFVSSDVATLLTALHTTQVSAALIHMLFTTENPNSTGQIRFWLLLALMGAVVLVLRIHIALPKRTTYGSSHFATWRETWPYLKLRLRRSRPKKQQRGTLSPVLPPT